MTQATKNTPQSQQADGPPTEDSLCKSIVRTYERIRHSIPGETETEKANTVRLMARDCIRWLSEMGKGLTNQDVADAFYWGAMGKLGGYTHISSAQLGSWLQNWKSHPMRTEKKMASRIMNPQKQLSENAGVTDLSKMLSDDALIETSKQKYLDGKFIDYGNLVYSVLRRRGLLEVTKEMWSRAAGLVKQEEITGAKAKYGRMEIGKSQLSDLINAISNRPDDKEKYKIRHKIVELWMKENTDR